MTATTSNEIAVRIFQITAGTLAAFFLYYGLDVRRKDGAKDFVAPVWQKLMKFCSFLLVGVAVWITLSVRQLNATEWLDLALMASGTAFVAAAKHALGKAHTFTGQYLEKPILVTRGIYAFIRNPLYFGVLQCELGSTGLWRCASRGISKAFSARNIVDIVLRCRSSFLGPGRRKR